MSTNSRKVGTASAEAAKAAIRASLGSGTGIRPRFGSTVQKG